MLSWPYATTIALLALPVWLLCWWMGRRLERRIAEVQSWPEIEVEVLQSSAPAKGVRGAAPRILFGWSDGGRIYRSRRIMVGAWTGRRREGEAFAAAHPVGRRLMARANPADPAMAILYARGDVGAWYGAGRWLAASMLVAALLLVLLGRG